MVVAPRAGEIHHSSTVIIGWCHCCFFIRSCNGKPGGGSSILGWWCCWVLMDWVAPQFLHHAMICSIQIGGFLVEAVPQSHYWWSCCVVHLYLQQINRSTFVKVNYTLYMDTVTVLVWVLLVGLCLRGGLAEKSFAICLSLEIVPSAALTPPGQRPKTFISTTWPGPPITTNSPSFYSLFGSWHQPFLSLWIGPHGLNKANLQPRKNTSLLIIWAWCESVTRALSINFH